MTVIDHSIQGPERLALLRLHRLIEFDRVFSAYLEGHATAQEVKERAKKMLAVGLPECLK